MHLNKIITPFIILTTSLIMILVITFFQSCKKDSAPLQYGEYPTDIGKIIVGKCATSGCHNDASYQAAANLNLSTYADLFKGSTSGSPVIPYRSDFSTLCSFVNTFDDLGTKNYPTMPINRAALSYDDVKTIKDWIDAGAPDIHGNIMWSDNPNRNKYYVLNQGCDVVTVFDAKTQLPMRYISVGNNPSVIEIPHMIRISPDGNYWYVVFVNNNILQKFRTSDNVMVGQVTLGPALNWNTLTISDDNKKAYCVSWQANSKIASVDLENMKVIHYYGGTFNAHGSALNATNDTLYVTSQTGNYIYKMDTSLLAISQVMLDGSSVPISSPLLDPHEILFSPDGTKYFVTCSGSNEVRVMQTQGDLLLATIPTGQYPLEMVKSTSKNKLYVTCQDEPNSNTSILGAISVIDMTTYATTKHPVGYQPHGLALDETNDYLIVASRNFITNGPAPHHSGVCGRNGFVSYFKLSTMQLLNKKTEVASDPYSVAIKP